MGFGKEARLITLLAIDIVFFFVEIIVGYTVGSIALVADSFHMLNDVISLLVALYAIKLATAGSTAKYSYGWQRAEILGALINGVFLLALCFSLFLECIERTVNVQEMQRPLLVVGVGSFGLLSNIVGLFLFHDHGHGGHSHGGHSHGHDHGHNEATTPKAVASETAPLLQGSHERSSSRGHKRTQSKSHSRTRTDSIGSLYNHPAQIRSSVIASANEYRIAEQDAGAIEELNGDSPSHEGHAHDDAHAAPATKGYGSTTNGHSHSHEGHDHHSHDPTHPHEHSHALHTHNGGTHDHSHEETGSHGGHGGHGHGSMNMQGVFLHVLGDALGNVGVIAAGLVIAFCKGSWRFYFDPLISLIITIIIFSSALPLVRSASFILLQAVPSTISLDSVRRSILEVDGVVGVHELHVWQLSESKIVASVHVLVGKKDYMPLVANIRKKLHAFGIHSATIQPELSLFNTPDEVSAISGFADPSDCLVACSAPDGANCEDAQCCAPPASAVGAIIAASSPISD